MENKGRVDLMGKDAEDFANKVGKEVQGTFKGTIRSCEMRPDHNMTMQPCSKQTETKQQLHVCIDITSITQVGAVRKGI